VELCSIHFAYGWKPDSVVANALFADGASAAVIGHAVTQNHGWKVRANASYLFPNSEDAMTY